MGRAPIPPAEYRAVVRLCREHDARRAAEQRARDLALEHLSAARKAVKAFELDSARFMEAEAAVHQAKRDSTLSRLHPGAAKALAQELELWRCIYVEQLGRAR